jgi:branched-chain amino acid transport system substrate-binding protein
VDRKRCWVIICLFVVVLFIVGQGNSLAQSEKVIKIGVSVPMTGPAAPWGLSVVCTMERFKVLFNGKWGGITVNGQKYKVDFVYADDKYTVAGGRTAGEKLIYIDKVDFLVGSLGAEPIAAWAPLATREKKLAILGGTTWNLRPEWPYVFRCTASDNERSEALVRLMKEQYGTKSVLYIIVDDLSGKITKENLLKREKARGLEVKGYLMVPPNTKDFYPFLSKALKSNPDYLHCNMPAGSIALIVKQARELGYKGKIGAPTSMPNLKKWQAIAGVEASMGYVAMALRLEELSSKGLDSYNLIEKMCPEYLGTEVSYLAQPDILMMAIEKAQSFDPDKIAKVLRTEKFDSYLKNIQLKTGGEKTYGIKNHIATPVYYSTIVGPEQVKPVGGGYHITSP